MPAILFTKDGFEKLKEEQAKLLIKRPDAVNSLQRARELGDLSENGAYKAARAELSQLDSRLRHLNRLLTQAKVIEAVNAATVEIGTRVGVKEGEKETTYSIVGGYESNPAEGKISIHSPIGRMLLGRKVGDTVEIIIPRGKVTYTITSIAIK